MHIDAGSLLLKLMLYIFVPLCVGKIIRHTWTCVPEFTKRRKVEMKLASSFLLIMVPWMSVSKSVEKMRLIGAGEVILCFGIGLLLHSVYFTLNYAGTGILHLPVAERKAVVILASQKTLPVSVTLINFLPESLGSKGIMVLPCIIAHFCQILMDGGVAARWASVKDGDGEELSAHGGVGGELIASDATNLGNVDLQVTV